MYSNMDDKKIDKLLTIDEVAEWFKCSTFNIVSKCKKDPSFPQPIGGRTQRGTSRRWIESEIQEYIEQQKAARK